jgi:hypothetical protein
VSPAAGYEADLDALVECRSDPPQHREGVAAVVGVLEPTDDRRGRADELRERALAEPSLGAKFVEPLANIEVRDFFLVKGIEVLPSAGKEPVGDDLDGVGSGPFLPGHRQISAA